MMILKRVTDSGISNKTPESDSKYIRFLNATILLFIAAQIPILSLLIILSLWTQLIINVLALSLCGISFLLNRRGQHLPSKIVFLSVVTANTAYFAIILGSSAPAHLWFIPMAVLGVLVFKPSEWVWMATLVGLSMVGFIALELVHHDLEPFVRHFSTAAEAQQAAQGSTIFAIILTLALVGMMHRRFAWSERSLATEKSQSDRLLRAILPDQVAQELRDTGTTQAIRHEEVSILFADIVGFTPLAASMPAEAVVALLADIFERFDRLIAQCGVEKIKTIGDAYMVASGVPEPATDHAERLTRCALGMLAIMETFSAQSGHHLQLRIGLHKGPVVAGVIGTTKFTYDLWGESVNLASRLESSGEPGRIHVSSAFRAHLENTQKFEEREAITIKGIGRIQTHWLISD